MKKTYIILIIIFGLLMSACKNNDDTHTNETSDKIMYNSNNSIKIIDKIGKIQIIKFNDVSEGMINNPNNTREQTMGWYGIEINIRCDYTKHSKFNDWEEEFYNDESQRDSYDTRPLTYHFVNFLNKKVYEYELVDDALSSQTNHSFWPGSEIIHVSYLARKDIHESLNEADRIFKDFLNSFYQSRDYKYLLELSKKDFVLKVEIIECSPFDNQIMDE